MGENFANTYQTTLNNSGTLTSGATSMVVTSATGAPTANFRVKIENELILVTVVAGTTFTITRGIEGTTDASHADGSTVTHVLTAASLNQGIVERVFKTTSLGTTEGEARWDATLRGLSVYDSVRERLVTPTGWAPYISHPGWTNNTPVAGTAVTLAAVSGGNGGAVAYAVFCGSPMLLQDYVVWQTSTSAARAAEVRLYSDRLNNSSTIDFVAGTDAAFSFTPGAAGRQVSGAVSGAPVVLAPGWYWVVIRNTSASQTFVLGTVANGSQLWFLHSAETQAIAALGSTIDMVTGWTTANALGAIMGRGRLFGQSAAW